VQLADNEHFTPPHHHPILCKKKAVLCMSVSISNIISGRSYRKTSHGTFASKTNGCTIPVSLYGCMVFMQDEFGVLKPLQAPFRVLQRHLETSINLMFMENSVALVK